MKFCLEEVDKAIDKKLLAKDLELFTVYPYCLCFHTN